MNIFHKVLVVGAVAIFTLGLVGLIKAATAVNLGTADSFAILAGSGITNTGTTTITGDVGSFPTTTQTGFGSVTITGTNHAGDATTQGAKTDLVTAYTTAAGEIPTSLVTADLGGQTLTPGVYKDNGAPASLAITGVLQLDAQGDPDAVFIFQSASTLVTASASEVQLLNGAQACNVFWQVGSSATLGTTSAFKGNILALASITDDGGSTIVGRLLARNGAVTLNNTVVTKATCASASSSSSSSSNGGGDGGASEQVPRINVTKVPNPLALPTGPGSVTYTYQVTNTGDLPLSQVVLTDNKCSPVNFLSGDRNNDSVLDLDELWTYRCTTMVAKSVTNTATVQGFANGVTVRDTAQATVVVGASPTPLLIPQLPDTGSDPDGLSGTSWIIISTGVLVTLLSSYFAARGHTL